MLSNKTCCTLYISVESSAIKWLFIFYKDIVVGVKSFICAAWWIIKIMTVFLNKNHDNFWAIDVSFLF